MNGKYKLLLITLSALSLLASSASEDIPSPQPLGCTENGTLDGSSCSKGKPIYIPDGKIITRPELVKKIELTWPADLTPNTSARINLQVVILTDGSVTDIRPMFLRVTLPKEEEQKMSVSEDEHGFIKVATSAVQQWRYKPATLNGEAVAVYQSICIDFEPQ